jgi:predicted nucleotidyltransferase
MPVRSLNSAVIKWPEPESVLKKAREWATELGAHDENIIRIYCFGSLAKKTWGVGSDCDLLIEVHKTGVPFVNRMLGYDQPNVGVPVEMLVYTTAELTSLSQKKAKFARELEKHAIVLYEKKIKVH